MNVTNLSVSRGVFPGACSSIPVSVESDQLLCFPDPLIPLNGFSCSRHLNPCFLATRFMIDISSIVEHRIQEMDMEEAEYIILSVMRKELRAIVWLGALLGAVMGTIMTFINI